MKKLILTIIVAIGFIHVKAQTYPYQDKINNVFALIDKSQISTGYLMEYGVPFSAFSGVIT